MTSNISLDVHSHHLLTERTKGMTFNCFWAIMSVYSLGYFYWITVVTLLDTCTYSTFLKIINKREEGENMVRVGRAEQRRHLKTPADHRNGGMSRLGE